MMVMASANLMALQFVLVNVACFHQYWETLVEKKSQFHYSHGCMINSQKLEELDLG